jgi:non-lysosomal glucosylceramidase
MKRYSWFLVVVTLFLQALTAVVLCADEIPKIAWRRPLGQPLSNPGTRKNNSDIDDGYWRGAPVGGFGAGTFSRTYRGDFARWHIKSGVHKYAPVYANQLAMFQHVQGEPAGIARVLMTDHPKIGELASWQWDYPVGAGEYAALFPKAWYDYKWEKFPAHVVLETVFSCSAGQLSRIQLSGCGVSLARGKSNEKRDYGFRASVVDEHGWMVSNLHP